MSATSRNGFLRAAEQEMARFEQREMEFRKKDRQERAAELQISSPSKTITKIDGTKPPVRKSALRGKPDLRR